MKKVFSAFLALMLFCSMTVTAMAESFQISTDKNVISAGENVTVTVKLDKTMKGNFRNVQGQLKYDTDTFTYVSHTMGEKYTHYKSKNMAGRKYFTFSNTNLTANGFSELPKGTVVTVVFKTNKDITATHVTAEFTLNMSVQDLNGKSVKNDAAVSVIVGKEHTVVTDAAVAATCTAAGLTEGKHCSVCGAVIVQQRPIDRLEHSWGTDFVVDKAATMKASGSKSLHCTVCSSTNPKSVVAIGKIKSVKVANKIYNGKNQAPVPTVLTADGIKLQKKTDYTVTYKNAKATKKVKPKAVGKYTAVITFKGDYSGTVNASFKINPKGTVIKKLTKKGRKQFTAVWAKKTVQVDGYQLRYSLKKNMKGAKTVNIARTKKTTKTIKRLKAKKTYYVQIRTYKKANGTKYYSSWSSAKKIKTK